MSIKAISSYHVAFSKNGNEYTEFKIAHTQLTAKGAQVETTYYDADGHTATELYSRAKEVFTVIEPQALVCCVNSLRSSTNVEVDEKGFYCVAYATDGTQVAYRHYIGDTIMLHASDKLNYKCGDVAFTADDRKLLEAYKVEKADGTIETKTAPIEKMRISAEAVAEVKGAYNSLVEIAKKHGLRIFMDYASETIEVGTENIDITCSYDVKDDDKLIPAWPALVQLGEVKAYSSDGDYLPYLSLED